MIAKVIAHGENRTQALTRMSGALEEMVIDGIKTNILLQQRLVTDSAFVRQPMDIHYLERNRRN
jgi:acetyl-CoA carboxylase biotin carboxylase subunit